MVPGKADCDDVVWIGLQTRFAGGLLHL